MVSVHRREIIFAIAVPIILVGIGVLWPGGLLARLVSVFFVLYYSQKIGGSFIDSGNVIKQWLVGVFSLVSLTSIIQTVLYYSNTRLDGFTDILSLALSIAILSIFRFFKKEIATPDETQESLTKNNLAWFTVFLVPAVIAFSFILKAVIVHGTTESIRTPWPLLPEGSFLALAILPVIAWLVAKKTSAILLTGIFTTLSALSVTLIAPFIYKLGYGFDGFLHRASQHVLLDTGTLSPKPLYYMGQYTLNTWLSRLFDLDISQIDTFLVPLGIIVLVISLFIVLRNKQQHAFAMSAVVGLLILSPFVATTPQAFAYLIGLSALILAFGTRQNTLHPIVPLLLALWCLAIHPLAGLPFIGAVLTILWSNRLSKLGRTPLRSPILYILILITTISVPLAFFVFSGNSGQIAWDMSRVWQFLPSPSVILNAFPNNNVALWADWANYVAFLLPIALWTLGLYAAKHNEDNDQFIPLLLISAGTWASGLILSLIGEFTFLINYERGNYSERLTLISYLLLFYPALIGFGRLSKRINSRGAMTVMIFLICFSAWYAGNVYNALPRHDAAAASRGWSVGRYDMEAVRFIEQDAAGAPYIVLANQSVSAAAVETYGFARYTKNKKDGEDIFYYPIPTGGTLYQLYLQAVAPEPSFDAILEAESLGKSDIVYVVLNRYWWDAERVAESLESKADKTTSFGYGQVRVFRFSSQR